MDRTPVNGTQSQHPDAQRSRLRAMIASIDGEMSRLSKTLWTNDRGAPGGGLSASWTELVEALALGPEPEVRTCPVCKKLGMVGATRCGYCWSKLAVEPGAKAPRKEKVLLR